MSDDQRATKVTPYEGYVGENLGELSNDSSLAENSARRKDEMVLTTENVDDLVYEDVSQNHTSKPIQAQVIRAIGRFKKTKKEEKKGIRQIFKVDPGNKVALRHFGTRRNVLLEHDRQDSMNKLVIHPLSPFRWYWDLMLVAILSFQLVVLPVSITFLHSDTSVHWLVINGIIDVIFIVDIFLNFHTGIMDYENDETTILNKKEIAILYLKGWFFIDFLSAIPFDHIYYIALSGAGQNQIFFRASRALKVLKLSKLLRLLRFSKFLRYLSRFEELLSVAPSHLRIAKLIGLMLLFSHWNACLQYLVPYLQEFPQNSWVVETNIKDVTEWEKYSWALYRALSHMLSIGYGRVFPNNLTDVWMVILSLSVGGTFFAIFIAVVSTVLLSMDSSRRLYNEKIQAVDEYMKHQKLPRQLRRKIHTFFENKFHGRFFNEEKIFEEISPSLKEEILMFSVGNLLRMVTFFSNASNDFLADIVVRLKHEVFMAGDIIIRGGKRGDRMYFIRTGIVDVLTADGLLAASLGDGAHFGEICLLSTENRRVATIRAATNCELFSLSSEHFDEVLEEYGEMKKVMEDVARTRLNRVGLDSCMPSNEDRKPKKTKVALDWHTASLQRRTGTYSEPTPVEETAFASTRSPRRTTVPDDSGFHGQNRMASSSLVPSFPSTCSKSKEGNSSTNDNIDNDQSGDGNSNSNE